MADIVLGKQYILSAYVPAQSGYYPFACLQEVSLSVSTELIPTTTVDSGLYRTFEPRLSEWKLSASGVMILRDVVNTYNFSLDSILAQVRREGYDIRLLWMDTSGYTRQIEGHVFIPESVFTGTAGQIGKWSIEMQGSGPLTINGAITINPTSVNRFTFDSHSGSSTYVQDASLVGRSIKWVDREDSAYEPITSGSPGPREVLYDSSTGRLTFPSIIGPNETISGLYE
jgi:hypothetical protein